MYLYARRGTELSWLDRRMEPLAAKQVWAAAMPVVLVVALGLSFVRLPAVGFAPTLYVGHADRRTGGPLLPAAGWQIHDTGCTAG